MSILDVVNRVAVQAGIPEFYVFMTNTGRTAREILTHAHEAGEEITRRAEWKDLYTNTTVVASASSLTLPSDFQRLVDGAPIIRTATPFTPFTPVQSRGQWATVSNVSSSSVQFYFVDGSVIRFAPAIPTGGATVFYIKKNWITTSGTATDAFANDADTIAFPEPLLALGILWRYRRAKGLTYADAQAEFEAEFAREIKFNRGVA